MPEDPVSNARASFELCMNQAARLHALHPEHPLLRYALFPDEPGLQGEFLKRFGGKESTTLDRATPEALAAAYGRYGNLLEEACRDEAQWLQYC